MGTRHKGTKAGPSDMVRGRCPSRHIHVQAHTHTHTSYGLQWCTASRHCIYSSKDDQIRGYTFWSSSLSRFPSLPLRKQPSRARSRRWGPYIEHGISSSAAQLSDEVSPLLLPRPFLPIRAPLISPLDSPFDLITTSFRVDEILLDHPLCSFFIFIYFLFSFRPHRRAVVSIQTPHQIGASLELAVWSEQAWSIHPTRTTHGQTTLPSVQARRK